MRLLFFIVLSVVGINCTSSKTTDMESRPLDGTWAPVKQVIGGKELPVAAFEKQKLIISDSNYTVIAESTDKGVTTYEGDKMDIYGKEGVNAGKHFKAIYKLENDQLTICYNLAGDSYPQAYETAEKPLYFLAVFKKEQEPIDKK